MLTTAPERTHYRALVAEIAAKAKAKLPECNGRVDKAVALVLAGDVDAQEGDGSWRVGSCTDPLVTHRVQGTSCSCDDSQYGRAPRGLCKHVLAVMIQMRTQELLPQSTTVETVPASQPLPEAPCSVNVRLMIAGRECQLTLRGVSEDAVLTRLEEVLQRYPVPQAASPASTLPPVDAPPQCPQHGAMQPSRTGKGWYCPHKLADGDTWCPSKGH